MTDVAVHVLIDPRQRAEQTAKFTHRVDVVQHQALEHGVDLGTILPDEPRLLASFEEQLAAITKTDSQLDHQRAHVGRTEFVHTVAPWTLGAVVGATAGAAGLEIGSRIVPNRIGKIGLVAALAGAFGAVAAGIALGVTSQDLDRAERATTHMQRNLDIQIENLRIAAERRE